MAGFFLFISYITTKSIVEKNNLITTAESIEVESMKALCKPFDGSIANDGSVYYEDFSPRCTAFVCATDAIFCNRILGADLDEIISASMLKDIVALYKNLNRPRFFLQVIPELLKDDVNGLLNDNGFMHQGNLVKSYKEVKKPSEKSGNIEIRIAADEDRERIADILLKSFSFPEELRPFCKTIVNTDGWTCCCASIDGTIAGTASLFVKDGMGELAIAATDQVFRGKGVQSNLIAARELLAFNRKCKIMFVETSEPTESNPATSYRNMMRYGFKELYRRANFLWKNGLD